MPGVIEFVRAMTTLPMSAHRLAIGERAPVDFGVLDRRDSYPNGSQMNFPLGGPSIGTVAPGDIPKETMVRFGVHVPGRATVRFRSDVFELHARGRTKAVSERGRMSSGLDGESSEIAEVFATGAPIVNERRDEAHLFVHVFSVAELPREFIIRVPDILVCGIWFRGPDFAYKYFSERNAIGVCGWA